MYTGCFLWGLVFVVLCNIFLGFTSRCTLLDAVDHVVTSERVLASGRWLICFSVAPFGGEGSAEFRRHPNLSQGRTGGLARAKLHVA